MIETKKVHVIGVPFSDRILVTQPFNGTVAIGESELESIGGIGNVMRQPVFSHFSYHIFHVPMMSRTKLSLDVWIKESHPELDMHFHEMQGVPPSAYVIEAKGASSRQSVVYGRFDNVVPLSLPVGSILHLCYLENSPCLLGDTKGSLVIGDFNNAMVCLDAAKHNASLLDILMLSLDESAAFKSQIGFQLLKEGCFIVAHEPLKVILQRFENGRLVEIERIENQYYLPQASNLTGNGDVFSGHMLAYLHDSHAVPDARGPILTAAIRHAQKETAEWLKERMHGRAS